MKVKHTVRALRALARFTSDRSAQCMHLLWREADLIAADGIKLVSIPLPPEPGRRFGVHAEILADWLGGVKDIDEGDPFVDEHDYRDALATIEADGDGVRITTDYMSGELRLPCERQHLLTDKQIDDVLSAEPVLATTPFAFNFDLLRDLRRVYMACRVIHTSPEDHWKNGIHFEGGGADGKAMRFRFCVADGVARAAIMPLKTDGKVPS